MIIHTDPSPAHKRNCYLILDKINEMNNDLIPKIPSPQTVTAIFLSFGWTMSHLLSLHQALELLFLEELFVCSNWAAGDCLGEVGSLSTRPEPTTLPASCQF